MNLRTFTKGLILATFAGSLFLASPPLSARTAPKQKQDKGEKKEEGKKDRSVLRVPTNAFEVIRNKVSDIEFHSSNYGIFGLNVSNGDAGGLWPRGSGQAYIFGGGVWFGAQKVLPSGDTSKLCVIGYNPNSGASWMIPGSITGPLLSNTLNQSPDALNKNRLYFSTDYSNFSGEPFDAQDVNGPNWPVWDASVADTLKYNRYLGEYMDDINMRNLETFPKGPAIISGEDIFSVYKDTDLSRYERISRDSALKKGYPIGIQVEQTVYTWGFGQYKDFLFIRYSIINKSGEDLLNCYMAPAIDMDIGQPGNDRATIYIPVKEEDTLNLAIQWSEPEAGRPYGYVGLDFLESPAIDSTGFIRKDKRVFTEREQVGLSVFQNWPIDEDPRTPEERYAFISDLTQRDIDNGPGDRRFLMSTGPFNMAPGDTARVVVGIMFAYGRSGITTGQEADRINLWKLDTFAQGVYDNNFRAPVAPDPARVTWKPLNHGVELNWDETSERSLDRLERGLDFAGYTILRGRRTPSSTGADTTRGWDLGFKTIGGFRIPAMPDSVTRYFADSLNNPSILGVWSRLPMLAEMGRPRITGYYDIYRYDTIRYGVSRDSVEIRAVRTGQRAPIFDFNFDPYDDNNDDSTLFNDGRYGDQFKNKAIRDIVRDAIVSIMDSITDGRRFIDVGDDNNDGNITANPDNLNQNEKLINNVDYYYQVLAYDAGSDEGTPSKTNSGIAGINEVRANPEAPPAGPKVTPRVIPSSEVAESGAGLGGIYNFRFISLDNDRLGQIFGGDTLEFEFQPLNPYGLATVPGTFIPNFFYSTEVIVRSRRSGNELIRIPLNYDFRFTDRSDTTLRLLDSNLSTRRIRTDSIYDARGVRVPINGSFITDPLRPVYNRSGIYKNTFGIAFDYAFYQYGDSLRPGIFGDTAAVPFSRPQGQGANTNLAPGRQLVGQRFGGAVNTNEAQRIPSIGQVKLEVEFAPGGTENVTVTKGDITRTFALNYLTLKVRNIAAYNRTVYDENGDPVDHAIQYNYEFPADPAAKAKADTTSLTLGLGRTIDIGKFALYAFGWLNSDTFSLASRRSQFARNRALIGTPNDSKSYVGTPNRYYTGGSTSDGQTLKFTHKLMVNGAEVFIDFAGMGSTGTQVDAKYLPEEIPTQEFQVGDKFTVDFTGGALGLPQPGAKVLVAIPSGEVQAGESFTDDMLEQISVVPNPYLINHIGQNSNTDRRLFITRLPRKCTIQLYTESGELLQTLDHDVETENGRVAVEVWDLLTKSNRQAQSQLIIIRISTPDGAETVKKVAVVVGGYRLNSR